MTTVTINASDLRRAIKPLSQIKGKDNPLVPYARLIVDSESFTIEVSDGEFSASLRYDATTVEDFEIEHEGPVVESIVSRPILLGLIKNLGKEGAADFRYKNWWDYWEFHPPSGGGTPLDILNGALPEFPQIELWEEAVGMYGPEFCKVLRLAYIAASKKDVDGRPISNVYIYFGLGQVLATDGSNIAFGGNIGVDALRGPEVLIPKMLVDKLHKALQEPENLQYVLDEKTGQLCFQTEDGQFFVKVVEAEYPSQVKQVLVGESQVDIMLTGTAGEWKDLMNQLKNLSADEADLVYVNGASHIESLSGTFQIPQSDEAIISDRINYMAASSRITFNPTHAFQIFRAIKSVKHASVGMAWNIDWQEENSNLHIYCLNESGTDIMAEGTSYILIPIRKEQAANAF